MEKAVKGNENIVKYAALSIVGVIVFSVVYWIYIKVHLNNKNCQLMNRLYKDFPLIRTINPNTEQFSYNLRDYYIKTAYNCCASGNFKNDFVNLCGLKECIRQGARCLDFQIFSLNNKPVIAVSSQTDFTVKESYNSIDFINALDVIADYAFSGSTCPNPSDPLIIHLRVMSKNKAIYDKMAEALYQKLERRLLGKEYSYENNGQNIGTTPLSSLMGTVILVVDKTNALFENTKLDEYVNIASNSVFMRSLSFHDVKYTPDMQELIEFNKKNMTICLPDLSDTAKNPAATIALKFGCQMVGMCFQNFDANMEFYDSFFDEAGSAFVLKPDPLRYIPVMVPLPPPPPSEYSYEQRPVEADYYSFNI
jgi:hypothetical protein